MDIIEINSIVLSFVKSNQIYHESIYKYGIFKNILEVKFPNMSDYHIKKRFDKLIEHGYIRKVPYDRSFRYQFINHSNIKADKVEESKQYEKDSNGLILVRWD